MYYYRAGDMLFFGAEKPHGFKLWSPEAEQGLIDRGYVLTEQD